MRSSESTYHFLDYTGMRLVFTALVIIYAYEQDFPDVAFKSLCIMPVFDLLYCCYSGFVVFQFNDKRRLCGSAFAISFMFCGRSYGLCSSGRSDSGDDVLGTEYQGHYPHV